MTGRELLALGKVTALTDTAPPAPPSCSPPQQHAHRDTQRNGLKLRLPLCHSAVASRREGPQTKSPVSSQDLLSVRKILERNQIARNYQTQIPPPTKGTIKIQNQSQMNWRELSGWEKVNRSGSNHSTGYKGLLCKHGADSC